MWWHPLVDSDDSRTWRPGVRSKYVVRQDWVSQVGNIVDRLITIFTVKSSWDKEGLHRLQTWSFASKVKPIKTKVHQCSSHRSKMTLLVWVRVRFIVRVTVKRLSEGQGYCVVHSMGQFNSQGHCKENGWAISALVGVRVRVRIRVRVVFMYKFVENILFLHMCLSTVTTHKFDISPAQLSYTTTEALYLRWSLALYSTDLLCPG